MKRTHVFIYVTDEEGERKFRGFFVDRPTAEAWVKKQEGPSLYEISEDPPVRKVVEPTEAPKVSEPVDDVAERTDKGMEKALAAVKEAKSA